MFELGALDSDEEEIALAAAPAVVAQQINAAAAAAAQARRNPPSSSSKQQKKGGYASVNTYDQDEVELTAANRHGSSKVANRAPGTPGSAAAGNGRTVSTAIDEDEAVAAATLDDVDDDGIGLRNRHADDGSDPEGEDIYGTSTGADTGANGRLGAWLRAVRALPHRCVVALQNSAPGQLCASLQERHPVTIALFAVAVLLAFWPLFVHTTVCFFAHAHGRAGQQQHDAAWQRCSNCDDYCYCC